VGIRRILPLGTTLLYLLNCIHHWQKIIKQRKLYAADAAIKGRVRVICHGIRFAVDCGVVDAMLPGDSATFSTVREMFGRDVYLRAFDVQRMQLSSVVDAGGNRGLFSLWAASAGADTCWVECQGHYLQAARFLWAQNGVENRVNPIVAALAVATEETSVSMGDVISQMAEPALSLIKIDIEGAEFQVFAGNPDWLRQVENLTMEVHRSAGSPSEIVAILRRAGFEVNVTDDDFNPVEAARASYIYASSVGALR
jgi:hypothetical protein